MLDAIRVFLRRLLRRDRFERELIDELAFHLETRAEDLVRRGLDPAEARRRARLEFGGVEQYKERLRARRPGAFLDTVVQDVVFAGRLMRRAPAVSAVAVVSLALGIGASTAIFSIADSLLLRSLPVPEPERLVLLREGDDSTFTNPTWEEIRNRRLFGGEFAWQPTRFDLAPRGETAFVDGMWASGRMFEVLGVPAVVGRTFTEADDRRGGGPDGSVAVISYGFWQRSFGGAADVIGRSLTIDRVPFTIVGVVPSAFFGLDVGRVCDVVVPLGTKAVTSGGDDVLNNRGTSFLRIMARLAPGQSVESATAALRQAQPAIRDLTAPDAAAARWLPPHLGEPFTLEPGGLGTSALRARYQRPLVVLMAGVVLVLLVACANIANLLLARATARRHELTVRTALGASRLRLARQLLTESVLLATAGAVLGLLVARWGSQLLVRQLSTPNAIVFLSLPLDWRVLTLTATAAALAVLLFGVAPALRAVRTGARDAVELGDRVSAGRRGVGFGGATVVIQISLSLTLVVGAGLFVRTFSALVTQELGLDPDRVLIATMNRQGDAESPMRSGWATFERVRDAVAAVPGVAEVAASAFGPVNDGWILMTVEPPDGVQLAERDRRVLVNLVSPRWFATMSMPILAGRDFTDADRAGNTPVAAVNEAFARRFFQGRSPVGRTVRSATRTQPGPEVVVVGLVRDAVYGMPRDPVPPTVYFPLAQAGGSLGYVRLCVRAAGVSPASLRQSLADATVGVDPAVRTTFRTLADQIGGTLVQERLLAMLSGFFGVLALVLAALGLYGVTAYAVSRRRAEMAIRMAVGASPGDVVRRVLARVASLVGIGVAIGAGVSLWAVRFVASLLFGLTPTDPSTFVGAAAVLAATGLLASWLPARRAARVDLAVVLRSE